MISIIIPTFQEEKTIRETILNLKNSLSLPFEIIVADGNSTDATVAIAQTLTEKVFKYEGPGEQNISKNRNLGAKHAQGEYLVFIDCDCRVLDPNQFFIKALSHFEKNPKLVALTCAIKVKPEVATLFDTFIFNIVNFNFFVINNILHRGAAQGKFQMIRTEAFKKVGGYNENLPASEDMELFSKLSKIGRTYIDTKLQIYHSARRAHAIGWFRLLFIWNLDALSLMFRGKVISKDWKPKHTL